MLILKQKIKAINISNPNEAEAIPKKEIKKITNEKGRPTKFNKKLDVPVNIYLSQGQLEAIDNKIKEIGFSVRQDYFRKLLRADILGFDEL